MSKSDMVYARMIITEEKILFNIEKIQKLINPKSKKQIIQLDDDMFFRDLIESVKTYLIEYPKKKNFPTNVYKEAYGLVEYATTQFEENTKKIENLIRQRELNILNATQLKEILDMVEAKTKYAKQKIKEVEKLFDEDIIEALMFIENNENEETQEYEEFIKMVKTRINNLESNLHIEIDMERIEDRSKALSFIGIEIADALKSIPVPMSAFEEQVKQIEEKQAKPVSECIKNEILNNEVISNEQQKVEKTEKIEIQEEQIQEQVVNNQVKIEEQKEIQEQYKSETTFVKKPSLWQRIKNSKFVSAIRYITKIRIVIDYKDALPEGRGEGN